MELRFLEKICEAYLYQHDAYKEFTKPEIKVIQTRILNEVRDMLKYLRENDLETYHLFYDQGKMKQQFIIREYLDLCFAKTEEITKDDVLTELDPFTTAFTIGAILSYLALGPLITPMVNKAASKMTFSMMAKFGKFLDWAGTKISKFGKHQKFRYAIIQQNIKECYTACGVDPKEVASLSYIYVTKDRTFPLVPQKAAKQGECLSDCYVVFFRKVIGITAGAYFSCIRNSPEYNTIQNASNEDILKVIAGLKVGTGCLEIYNVFKDGIENYNELIDFIYQNKNEEKQNALFKLRDELIRARNETPRSSQSSSYKPSNTTYKPNPQHTTNVPKR